MASPTRPNKRKKRSAKGNKAGPLAPRRSRRVPPSARRRARKSESPRLKRKRARKPASVWIFGYGSLIWDGWENSYGCTRRVVAELPGYQRSFNKASVERWGNAGAPGPTLNVIPAADQTLRGTAFQFPAAKAADIREYLARREGAGFPLREHTVRISPTKTVQALVPVYEGGNLINASNVDAVAAMVCEAVGSGGRCVDYVKGIAAKLADLGIEDRQVTDLLAAIERRQRVA